MELFFQKSLMGRLFTRNNAFLTRTNDPSWSQIPSEIGIDSFEDYRILQNKQMYQRESMLEVCEQLDFFKFSRIGEIGGSPFIQAKTLQERYPHLSFLLSDRHEVFYNSIQSINIFRNANFFTFNAFTDNLECFSDCDLLMLWGVDLFYDDHHLIELLKFAKENAIKVLISSRSVEHIKYSPKRILKMIPGTSFVVRAIRKNNFSTAQFVTGVYRSALYYRKLSQVANVAHKDFGRHNIYRVHLFN